MPGYLYKNDETQKYQVGVDASAEAQTGKYLDSMNEFQKRNSELQESLWRGRDSDSMKEVKTEYSALSSLMNEEIPLDDTQFAAKHQAIDRCYERLIEKCEAYITSHKHPITPSGKNRKAMVRAILSSAKLEKAALNLGVGELQQNRSQGMIWGNIFGEIKEDIEFCSGVYSSLEQKFQDSKSVPEGSKSLELMRITEAASAYETEDERGSLISDMAGIWMGNHHTPEMEKELLNLKASLAGRLKKYYDAFRSYNDYSPFLPLNARKSDAASEQYARFQLSQMEEYRYYQALLKLMPSLGLRATDYPDSFPADLTGNPADYPLLKAEKLREIVQTNAIDRKTDARKILQGYVSNDTLDQILGELLVKRIPTEMPYEVKRPDPQKLKFGELTGTYTAVDYVGDMNELRPGRNIDLPVKPDDPPEYQGKELTASEKWDLLRARINRKYNSAVIYEDIADSAGNKMAPGLNPNRVFLFLRSRCGEGVSPDRVMSVVDRLLARTRVGTGQDQITAAEADRQLQTAMDDLIDIYLNHMRRFAATYGKLIYQLHPEDVGRLYGKEFRDDLHSVQDTEQVLLFMMENRDMSTAKAREYRLLSDYMNDVHARINSYFFCQNGTTPQDTCWYIENIEGIRRLALNGSERYRTVPGPSMTREQYAAYKKSLPGRLKKLAPANGELLLFGDYRM